MAAARGGNLTSTPAPRVDELALAGLTPAPAHVVSPPRVAESPFTSSARWSRSWSCARPTARRTNTTVFGEVVGVHIADEAIVDGRVDALRLDPIARLGHDEYTRVVEVFAMTRPGWPI